MLDCSSSLSPREPRLPQDTLKTINTRKLGKHCRHTLVISALKTVMIHPITIFEGEESWWGKLGRCSEGGSSASVTPESSGRELARAAWQLRTVSGLAGQKRLSNTARDATGHRRTAATQPQMSQCQIYQPP